MSLSSSPFEINRVKILVLGDSGVGKTSFVHLVCRRSPITRPACTVGCSVELCLHEYGAGTPQEVPYFVEFWDIGGSRAYANSHHIFYAPCHGLILVHDIINRKSMDNLRIWLGDIFASQQNSVGTFSPAMSPDGSKKSPMLQRKLTPGSPLLPSMAGTGFDAESFAMERDMPILVVGTKLDLAESRNLPHTLDTSRIAQECGADEIRVNCAEAKSLGPASTSSVKLARFLDRVIERQYYKNARTSNGAANLYPFTDRRKRLL